MPCRKSISLSRALTEHENLSLNVLPMGRNRHRTDGIIDKGLWWMWLLENATELIFSDKHNIDFFFHAAVVAWKACSSKQWCI